MAPRVDVVCVAYGSVVGLEAVLRAAGSELTGSIVLVDHGAPGSRELASGLGAVWLLDQSNPGFGSGQNRGVAAGDAELLLLLNPDCVMHPGALEAGVAHLDHHPTVAMVQGIITNEITRLPERSQGIELGPLHLWGRAIGARRLLRVGFVRSMTQRWGRLSDHVERVPDAPIEVETLAATAVLVRRAAFESIGGFDSNYFLYGEDLDLCRRLRSAGWALVALPVPWATHVSGGSSSGWVARELSWWEGTMQFAARSWRWPAFLGGLAAASLRATAIAVRSPRDSGDALRRLVLHPVKWRGTRSN